MTTDDRSRSFKRIQCLESKVRELSFLQETSQLLTATLDLDTVLRSLMTQVRDHFQVEAVSVAVLDERSEKLTFRVAVGEAAEAVIGLQLHLGEGIAGWVAQHGETVLIPDAYKDSRFFPGVDEKTEFRTRTVLAVPITADHQTIGAIEALNPITGAFDETAPQLLARVADQAAAAIRNAEVYERARRAEHRYERLFHGSPAPIVVMDFDTTILDLNQRAVELLGRPKEELIGSPWCPSVDGDTSSCEATIHNLRKSRQVSAEMRIPSQGSLHTFEALMTVIDYGEHQAIQWIGHDITEQIELARMQDDLMHMIVHDLRNPLSNIVSSLQMIQIGLHRKDERLPTVEVLEVAMRSSKRLQRLIDSLLDVRQLEEGIADLNRVAVPPKLLALEAIELVRPVVEKKQQELSIGIAADLPPIWVDRDMITRVLTNLLDNATKFTAQKGEIALRIERSDAELLFTVSDTGPGISPESQKYIFRRFQRLEGARGTKGTGLGLSFCKLAVEAHGGKIWLDSVLGEGSQFMFSLPLEVQ